MTGLRTSRQWVLLGARRQRALRWPLLASTLLLGACANLDLFGSDHPPPPPPTAQPQPQLQTDNQPVAPPVVAPEAPPPPPVPPIGPRVGILLPLSGPNGGLGASMLRAARLALSEPGSPLLDAHDTAGAGAAGAATAAIQGGDRILLGPLTSADTAAVAPVARTANVPVLAFTSDVGQAGPGVWVMGVTPEQQVRRLVFAAKDDGRTRIAALLPSGAVGDAVAAALTQACTDAALPAPTILTHAGTRDSIDAMMKQISDLATRQAVVDQQVKTAQAATATTGPVANAPPSAPVVSTYPMILPMPKKAPVAGPPPPPLPPPPFDALLLADTGAALQSEVLALHDAGIASPQVRIMGPTLWGAFASKLHALAGAWYAAPDPAARLGFVQQYRAAYGQAPKLLSDLPYDAAALAHSLAPSSYANSGLIRSDGFAGVDGVFALKPDGHVQRALAIFQVQTGGGSAIVKPAPTSLSDPAS